MTRKFSLQWQIYVIEVILPIILMISMIIPGCFFFILYNNRKKLHSFKMMRLFSFLYTEYRPCRYYWEFMKMN